MKVDNRLKILCIEDDVVVADYISSILDKNLYHVSKISDGKQALDYLLTTQNPPDIILLDYILPSLNGLQILRKIKEHKKNYPVVFLTVDESLETAVMAMKEGALDYLTKGKYLKNELNIKIDKAYRLHQERLEKEYFEEQLTMLNMAVEQSPNSVVVTNDKGEIIFVNNKFTQFTGYSFEEVKGKNPRILKTESYPSGFFEELWKTISSGKVWQGEFINKRKDGELFFERASISPVKNKEDKIVSYIAIKENITNLKEVEKALHSKNQDFDRMFTVVVDLLCIVDSNTRKFIRVNKAWENILGFTIDEIIGKSFTDFIHPDDIESSLIASKVLKENGRLINFVNRYQCKNGNYKFIEWSSITDNDGKSYSSARDITSRIKNQMALSESEARFRSIFEISNSGIFFCDKNGQIILVNHAFQNLVEYSTKELYFMDFSQFTHIDDLSIENEFIRKLLKKEINQYRLNKRYISKSGKTIWVDLAVAVHRDDDGNPHNYIGVVNDISEQKLFEQKLQDTILTKDKFYSIISHDLRNQFSGIQGLSEILLEQNQIESQKQAYYLSLLHKSGKNALALLENLLSWSRSQTDNIDFKPRYINLFSLVKNVSLSIGNQAAIKNIEIINNVPEDFQIFADENMFSTVIRNLLNNAVKFTPCHGNVSIYASKLNGTDLISVTDTGVGLKEETIAKLFKMNETSSTIGTLREKGSGLGLILCNEFVTKHGGKIIVESELGKGSTFTVSIPSN